jgi:hypothetical protein
VPLVTTGGADVGAGTGDGADRGSLNLVTVARISPDWCDNTSAAAADCSEFAVFS